MVNLGVLKILGHEGVRRRMERKIKGFSFCLNITFLFDCVCLFLFGFDGLDCRLSDRSSSSAVK